MSVPFLAAHTATPKAMPEMQKPILGQTKNQKASLTMTQDAELTDAETPDGYECAGCGAWIIGRPALVRGPAVDGHGRLTECDESRDYCETCADNGRTK